MSSNNTSQEQTSSSDNMQIFIKNVNGDATTTLTVSPTTSIATIKSLLTPQPEATTSSTSDSPTKPASPPAPSSNFRLVFAGRHLDSPESTLQDYNIPASSTLHLAQPLVEEDGTSKTSTAESTSSSSNSKSQMSSSSTTSTPSKSTASRKPRCTFKTCNAVAQRVVGDCGFCGGHFCGKHRLLESHACAGLEDCKDEARERNRERLETERTVVVRGV